MANANFIVQNGISIGGTSGATITADPTTGAVAIAPAATASTPNPVATVFTTSGTVTTVATTGGVPSTSDLGAAANTSTTSGATIFANITMTGNLASNSTGYFTIPAGTSAQRPGTPAVGMMRYNSTITSFEGYYAGAWSSLGGVKSVDGKSYIIAERSAGAADDVIRVYAGDSGTSTQAMWASTSNISILPTTTSTTPLTGALQVAGGAGVNGALFVGGGITTGTVSAATIGNASAVLYGTLNSSSASQPNVTTLAGLTGFGTSGVTTTAAGNFTITGSLTVNGTTTTINNTTVETTEYVQTIDATTVRSVTIGNSGAVLYGTLNSSSASQPNITTLAGVTSIGASGSTTLTGTLQTAAQTNVTSLGTLTGLTTGTILPSANVTQNLGSTTAYWNNIYAVTSTVTATSAKYADLAENYQADKAYMAGTVLMFGGSAEVTVADADTPAVAGVVSTNPAHLMNGGLTGTNVVPLALQGRVPCQVIGPVHKGDLMVSAGHGFAKVNNSPAVGTVIGKALQEVTFAGKAVIEVVVGRV